jgi:AAA family ATP:ADP antiporter
VLIARVVSRRASRAESPAAKAAADKPIGGTESGFAMIRKDRYLALIAALTILLNVVNTTGEYLYGRYVVEEAVKLHGAGAATAAAREEFIGAAYSHLFSMVNLLGFLLQMFVVSRLFKFLGVGKSLFVHPIVALAGYLMMLKAPSMQLMGGVKIADNSIDYSLDNTNKQALWLPTSREAKYKAKQAVDSFYVRMGDVASAGIVFVGEHLAFAIPAFALINVVLVGGWLGVVALLNSMIRRKAQEEKTAAL